MSSELIQCFEEYQKSRVDFVLAISELAQDPKAVPILENAGVMNLLKPLLLDNVPSVQQLACLAIGRLASQSVLSAQLVVDGDLLPQLIYTIQEQNKQFKISACYVIRSVAKQSPKLAAAVVEAGVVETLVNCLEYMDSSVKEAALYGLDYIARHSADLAQVVVDHSAIGPLILCCQEPELSVKRIAVCTLADIAKHNAELAKMILEKDAINIITPLIFIQDLKLKQQVCAFLAQIGKHSASTAQTIVETKDVLKNIVECIQSKNEILKKNAATCIRVFAKHSSELAQSCFDENAVDPLVINVKQHEALLESLMALGNIANFNENFAQYIISSDIVPYLYNIIAYETRQEQIQRAAIFCLGMLGQHSYRQTKSIVQENCLELMSKIFHKTKIKTLKDTALESLKKCIRKCEEVIYLNPLLESNHYEILFFVIEQLDRVLHQGTGSNQKKIFVESKGFEKLQKVKVAITSSKRDATLELPKKILELISIINSAYPDEVVKFYTPGYYERVIEKHNRTGKWEL